jgi:hypothetical protein
LGAKGCAVIAAAATVNIQLTSLDLDRNGMSDMDALAIQSAMQHSANPLEPEVECSPLLGFAEPSPELSPTIFGAVPRFI